MKYDPIKRKICITPDQAELAALSLLFAMKCIRQLANLPLGPYKKDGPLGHDDHAQKGIIDAAKHLGLDIGPDWGNQYDLKED